MNIDTLLIGLLAFLLGLIGLVIKADTKDYSDKSYTGVQFSWSVYLLIGVGAFLIIWSFFND